MALTRKQEIFVLEYLNCWNASEAARRAGYKGQPSSVGSQLLANISIAAEVERQIAERQIKPPEVLTRLTEHARADIGAFFRESFRWSRWPLPTDEIVEEREEEDPKTHKKYPVYKCRRLVFDLEKMRDPDSSKLIRKFADSPKNGISIELYDSQAALEKLGKALGVLTDRMAVTTQEVIAELPQVDDENTLAAVAGSTDAVSPQ